MAREYAKGTRGRAEVSALGEGVRVETNCRLDGLQLIPKGKRGVAGVRVLLGTQVGLLCFLHLAVAVRYVANRQPVVVGYHRYPEKKWTLLKPEEYEWVARKDKGIRLWQVYVSFTARSDYMYDFA